MCIFIEDVFKNLVMKKSIYVSLSLLTVSFGCPLEAMEVSSGDGDVARSSLGVSPVSKKEESGELSKFHVRFKNPLIDSDVRKNLFALAHQCDAEEYERDQAIYNLNPDLREIASFLVQSQHLKVFAPFRSSCNSHPDNKALFGEAHDSINQLFSKGVIFLEKENVYWRAPLFVRAFFYFARLNGVFFNFQGENLLMTLENFCVTLRWAKDLQDSHFTADFDCFANIDGLQTEAIKQCKEKASRQRGGRDAQLKRLLSASAREALEKKIHPVRAAIDAVAELYMKDPEAGELSVLKAQEIEKILKAFPTRDKTNIHAKGLRKGLTEALIPKDNSADLVAHVAALQGSLKKIISMLPLASIYPSVSEKVKREALEKNLVPKSAPGDLFAYAEALKAAIEQAINILPCPLSSDGLTYAATIKAAIEQPINALHPIKADYAALIALSTEASEALQNRKQFRQTPAESTPTAKRPRVE